MSEVVSFTELDGQRWELLPDRAVMSIFRADPSFLPARILLSEGANADDTCIGTAASGQLGNILSAPTCQSAIDPGAW